MISEDPQVQIEPCRVLGWDVSRDFYPGDRVPIFLMGPCDPDNPNNGGVDPITSDSADPPAESGTGEESDVPPGEITSGDVSPAPSS